MPINQDIITLFDKFTHGGMSRRAFMRRLAAVAGGSAAAMAMLSVLENDYARAAMVAEDDSRIVVDNRGPAASYVAEGATISGYLARPAGDGKHPAVMVIHENRGLNPHIQDVTRRLALEGFLAYAPDMLSPDGGTPEDPDKAREMIGALDGETTALRLAAAVPFLADHSGATGAVGAIGFCWGGGMVNEIAIRAPKLAAGVAYYGRQPAAERVASIEAALLLHYAGLDERINAGIEAYRAALEANGKDFQIFIYDGVNHAFNNDTNAARYDPQAAELAWSRTVDFLKERLS